MNCEAAQKRLSLALDGEIRPGDRAELERHLAGCPHCRAARDAWAESARLLRASVALAPPAEVMWNDVRRAIHAAEPVAEARPGLLWRLRWAGASIAAVVVAFAGLTVLRHPGAVAAASAPAVEWAETGLPGANTMVMEDPETGAVVIWVMTGDNGNGARGT